jgi:exodeoxyribonuclease V, alpha subunit
MLGKAQQLFSERLSKCKTALHSEQKIRRSWDFLERLLSNGCLSYIDFALAQQYASEGEEEIAAFLCHLSRASRQGHLCIKIDDQNIQPSPADVWSSDDGSIIISDNDLKQLNSLIIEGANKLPPTLMHVHNATLSAPHTLFLKDNSLYYFHKSWALESDFITNLKPFLSDTNPAFSIDTKFVTDKVHNLQSQNKLLPEQAAAILLGCQSTLTLITGGPGTGKTYTAGMLLSTLLDSISTDQKNVQIILAAPTGKAAANLEASIKRALTDNPNFPDITGTTLHQLLKISRPSSEHNVLSADIIIVDECSMIDANLMGRLLWSVKPGARLIMLGDKNQLPSVEAGSLFADMAEFLSNCSGKQKFCVELVTCLRAESKSISDFSEQIKNGDTAAINALFGSSSGSSAIHCVTFTENMSPKEQQHLLLKHALKHLPTVNQMPENPAALLKEFNKFRILTPLRKGLLGSEALNAAIHSAVQAKSTHGDFLVFPIMIVKNDHRLGLFNGEVGLFVKSNSNDTSQDIAIFPARHSNLPVRRIPAILLPKYEKAYSLSIHKSQGSEFDHVVLLLPEGAQSFGREGLYTGASRAKKQLEIWSRPSIVSAMTEKRAIRLSGVLYRLSHEENMTLG